MRKGWEGVVQAMGGGGSKGGVVISFKYKLF